MAIDTIPHGSGDDVKPNIVVVGGSYVGKLRECFPPY